MSSCPFFLSFFHFLLDEVGSSVSKRHTERTDLVTEICVVYTRVRCYWVMPSCPSGQRLSRFPYSPLDGMLVYRRVTSGIKFAGTHLYTALFGVEHRASYRWCYYSRNIGFRKSWQVSVSSTCYFVIRFKFKNSANFVDTIGSYPCNKSLSFLFFSLQQSLTIMQIKANFTAFIPLQPEIIM